MKTKNTVTSKMRVLATLVFILSSSLAMAEDTARADHEKMRVAFKECADSLGIAAPTPGQRPQAFDDTTRSAIDACLKEKGFSPPKHRGSPPGDDRGGPQGNQ